MAKILFTWELGGGLGHLVTMLPLAKGLRERGHHVSVALRDLSRAERVFAGTEIAYLQAPVKITAPRNRIEPPRTFAHILHNSGFGDFGELKAMTDAWRNLYDYVEPDLIVFDHAPTALLAARGSSVKRAIIGTGFCCPDDCYPLPDLRPWDPGDPDQLQQEEDQTLAHANRVLRTRGEAALERLSQLYSQADQNFLTTFKELDHYPDRKATSYWGIGPGAGGIPPTWPSGEGKRVFAYLKPFPALPKLLAMLNQLGCPAIVYGDAIPGAVRQHYRSETLQFEDQRLDLGLVGRQCDLAILNGGHGTTATMLLHGKPTLQLPIFLEQAMNGAAVERLGAGLSAPIARPKRIAQRLKALLDSDRYAQAARCFASRYAQFDPAEQTRRMVRRATELVT